LIALEHAVFIPGEIVEREGRSGAGLTFGAKAARPRLRPGRQRLLARRQGRGAAGAPILPRKEPRPGGPLAVGRVRIDRRRREGEITYRDHPGPSGPVPQIRQGGVAALVAEGVELLDVAEFEPGLSGHEGAQRKLERPMSIRVEGAERKAREGPAAASVRAQGQHHRLALANGHDHRRQADDDAGAHQYRTAKSKGTPQPASLSTRSPIAATASTSRPRRFSMSSARATIRRFG